MKVWFQVVKLDLSALLAIATYQMVIDKACNVLFPLIHMMSNLYSA
jgi:hypothetical protein